MSQNTQQSTLVDTDDSTDTDSRPDTGASEAFLDDRDNGTNRETDTDAGQQYELVAEENPGKGFTTTQGQSGFGDFSEQSEQSEESEPDDDRRPAAEIDLSDDWERVDAPRTLYDPEFAYENDSGGLVYVIDRGAKGWAAHYVSPAFNECYHIAESTDRNGIPPLSREQAVSAAKNYLAADETEPHEPEKYIEV